MRMWAQLGPVRLAAVALLAAAALLVPSPAAASLSPGTPAGTATTFKVADPVALEALIKSRPRDFGGMFLDPATDTLVVQLVGGPRAAAARQAVSDLPRAGAELSGLTASTTMRFRTVAHSRAELEKIKERVTTDRAWSKVAGPVLSEWYVDVFNNRVAVSVTRLTDAVRRAATAAFGAAVELSVKPLAVPTAKQDDSAPWTGGAQIAVSTAAGFRDCSSAFTLVGPNGERAGLTAGHCTDAVGNSVTHNGVSMGKVVTREYAGNGHDFAIYSGSTYQNRVYDGLYTALPVTSVTSFVLLGSYGFCFGGYTMGDRNCAGRITGLETCAGFYVDYNPKYTVCGLMKANSTKADYLARDGDSGGPVYQLLSPIGGGQARSVSAVGLIVGRPGQDHTSAYFHMLGTVLPAGWSVALS